MRRFRNGSIGRRWLQGWCYVLLIVAGASVVACGGGGGGGGGGGSGGLTDTAPPSIGSITVSPSLLTVGAQAQIEAEVSDLQSGVQVVTAMVTYPDNTQATVALQPTGNGARYAGAFTARWTLTSVSQARVVVQAVDNAGNRASREQTIRTIAAPPAPPF
jgi:hypothetical protein